MKNITLSANDNVIDGLCRIARSRNTTLNDMFRLWADKQVVLAERAEREKHLKALVIFCAK